MAADGAHSERDRGLLMAAMTSIRSSTLSLDNYDTSGYSISASRVVVETLNISRTDCELPK